MLAAAMPRRARPRLLALAAAAAAMAIAACGEQGIQLAEDDPNYEGAKIFQQSCSGCHTLEAAGTQGSAYDANGREYVDGPSFDARKEQVDQVLYAIRNGGFASGPMPQDIVVGEDAEKVAEFVAEYSGGETTSPERTDTP
jgi:mono/diheme cytochrome c family protein